MARKKHAEIYDKDQTLEYIRIAAVRSHEDREKGLPKSHATKQLIYALDYWEWWVVKHRQGGIGYSKEASRFKTNKKKLTFEHVMPKAVIRDIIYSRGKSVSTEFIQMVLTHYWRILRITKD